MTPVLDCSDANWLRIPPPWSTFDGILTFKEIFINSSKSYCRSSAAVTILFTVIVAVIVVTDCQWEYVLLKRLVEHRSL